MNICIYTVYNSENCGSFWQAYALQEYLRQQGHEVCFMYRTAKNTSHDIKKVIEYSIKAVLKLRFKRIPRYFQKYYEFENVISKFNIIQNLDENIDLCIFGSDTIWELSSSYFYNNRHIYWGGACQEKPRMSYAPSVGNSTPDLLKKNSDLSEKLNKFSFISVRDNYSKQCIQLLTEKEIQVVCDPTWLFDKNFYNPLTSIPEEKNYLLVYSFGKIPKDVTEEIAQYAHAENLMVLSFGESFEKCDKHLVFEPYRFLSYFRYADKIFTNTFHGTLFSIMFEKNFISYVSGKKKIMEVLKEVKGMDRVYQKNMVTKMYNQSIDYKELQNTISAKRENSRKYLNDAIRGIYENN